MCKKKKKKNSSKTNLKTEVVIIHVHKERQFLSIINA